MRFAPSSGLAGAAVGARDQGTRGGSADAAVAHRPQHRHEDAGRVGLLEGVGADQVALHGVAAGPRVGDRHALDADRDARAVHHAEHLLDAADRLPRPALVLDHRETDVVVAAFAEAQEALAATNENYINSTFAYNVAKLTLGVTSEADTVQAARDKAATPTEIGKALNVNMVLFGTVQRAWELGAGCTTPEMPSMSTEI